MLRNLFQTIFGSFSRKQKAKEHRLRDKELIARMIMQAEEIANGSYLTESELPPPVIPERRKVKR